MTGQLKTVFGSTSLVVLTNDCIRLHSPLLPLRSHSLGDAQPR